MLSNLFLNIRSYVLESQDGYKVQQSLLVVELQAYLSTWHCYAPHRVRQSFPTSQLLPAATLPAATMNKGSSLAKPLVCVGDFLFLPLFTSGRNG